LVPLFPRGARGVKVVHRTIYHYNLYYIKFTKKKHFARNESTKARTPPNPLLKRGEQITDHRTFFEITPQLVPLFPRGVRGVKIVH